MPSKDIRSRVVAKAATWRVLATADTIFLSWFFTRTIATALRIGLTEVITKIILFYLHERIWEKVNVGMQVSGSAYRESHYRSIIKGFSWRFFGTIDTILLALFWTGSFTKAFAIGGAEVITKVILFWFHERLWIKVNWGKRNNRETPNIPSSIDS